MLSDSSFTFLFIYFFYREADRAWEHCRSSIAVSREKLVKTSLALAKQNQTGGETKGTKQPNKKPQTKDHGKLSDSSFTACVLIDGEVTHLLLHHVADNRSELSISRGAVRPSWSH